MSKPAELVITFPTAMFTGEESKSQRVKVTLQVSNSNVVSDLGPETRVPQP